MKKSKDYTLLAYAIPVAICVLSNLSLGCEAKKEKQIEPVIIQTSHEYEFDLEPDSIIVYDGTRLVGKVAVNWDRPSPLDSLLLKDNE